MIERSTVTDRPSDADRFRTLFDSVPVGIFRTTPDGRILDVNPALVRIMGYPDAAALMDQPVTRVYANPADRLRFKEIIERTGVVRDLEVRVRRHDGQVIWTRNSATAHRDANGRTLWYDGVMEDISDQKRAADTLQRRLAIEQTLAAISARFVGRAPVDTAIEETLADMSRLSGASRAYLFRIRPDDDLMDNTHEWCAPGVANERENLQGLPVDAFPWWMSKMRRGEPIHVKDLLTLPPEASAERAILEPQGIKSVLAFPVHVGERLDGFLGFDNVRDAESWREEDLMLLKVASRILGDAIQRREAEEALRVSEQRYRLLVEQSPLAIQVVSPHGDLLRVNRAWERLWGMRWTELRDWRWQEDRQLEERGVSAYMRRALMGETVEMPPVTYVPRRGAHAGREIWVRATIYPLKDDAGNVQEIVVIQEDITERRHAENELERSRHQLALTEKLSALGALVSGVAHEIRTPLTYINNNVFMLDRCADRLTRDRPEPEEVAREVKARCAAAVEGVERIEHLVESLRGYAKLDTGRQVPAELDAVVRGAVELFRATHRGRIDVRVNLQPGPRVVLDREQIQQVVLNLLNNSAEAMPKGGAIRVTTRPAAGGMLLEVEDEGPGIPAQAAVRMFEPFYSTKREGTGLGLSISKRIIEAHGGVISYEGREGGGARFLVELPTSGSGA